MWQLSLQACAKPLAATLIGGDASFSGVSTDTRTLKTGDAFVALSGQRVDAHDKIDQTVAGRASALVVQRRLDANLPQLLVEDTRVALGGLAQQWRRQLVAPVIALTGSNGKTTTKEMSAAILQQCGNVFATQGNFNNAIGLPLSLLSTREQHDYVVLEMGASQAGDIARLTDIARPTVALITNAGSAHLEGFGSVAGVALAKGELFAGLGQGGSALINVDDHYAGQWREMAAGRRIIGFGFAPSADVRGEFSEAGELRIHHLGERVSLVLPLRGRHNAMNALAAAAAALAVGAPLSAVQAGLQSVRPSSGRLECKRGRNGVEIIDDTYNANPDSLRVGLQRLGDQPTGATWCVLGDMRELGGQAARLHRQMGAVAKRCGVDHLWACGEFADELVAGFGASGRAFSSIECLVRGLQDSLGKQDRVLVKGSRGARMERVVAALLADNHETKERH